MSQAEVATLLTFCAAMTFSPGPNTTLSTALAANHGLRRAVRFAVAVATGWVLLMLACGLGLGAVVAGVPPLRWAVKLLGVAYLLWLAHRLIGSSGPGGVDADRLSIGFVQGVALQVFNIKAWMLVLTLSVGWVLNAGGQPVADTGHRLAVVAVVVAAFGFTSNMTYAVVGSVLRWWLACGARLRWFNRFLALVLVLTAAWMVAV